MSSSGNILVDLDGTLAKYTGWREGYIGDPIPAMMNRVKSWLEQGITVKIFTARATDPSQIPLIHSWLEKHGLPKLDVVCCKDYATIEMWDDRAVQVKVNTGQRADGQQD